MLPGFLLLRLLPLRARGGLGVHNVGEGRALQDLGGRIAHVEKDLIEGAMFGVAIDQCAQLLRIAKRRKRAINEPDNL